MTQVRQMAQEKIKTARQEIEQSASVAKTQIEGTSSDLTAQILKAILPAGISASEVVQ